MERPKPPPPLYVCDFPPVLEGLQEDEAETPSLSQVPTSRGISPAVGTLPVPHHPDGHAPPPQINLNESMQVVSRRVVTVAYGEPVHHVMQFDPADPGYLYLMTSHQVRPEPWPDGVPGHVGFLPLCLPPGVPSLPTPSPCTHHLCRGALFPLISPVEASSLNFPGLSWPSPLPIPRAEAGSPAELGPPLCL